MKLNRKAANGLIAGFLAVVVMTVGFFAYQQKASADTILPGFATAHIALRVTVPTARSIKFRVVFNPTNGSKRFYFKERSFDFATPGLNSVEWYIRKLPAGTFTTTVTADSTTLEPQSVNTNLVIDSVTDTAKFELNLGMPPVPTPTPEPVIEEETFTPEAEESLDTSTDLFGADQTAEATSSIPVPPVPQLPTN